MTIEKRIQTHPHRPLISRQVVVRVLADVMLVSGSLLLAILFRFAWSVLANEMSTTEMRPALLQLVNWLVFNAWEIVVLSVSLLAVFGVYSHTRFYQGRYKLVAITTAILLAYLIFALTSFVLNDEHAVSLNVLLLAAVLNIASLSVVRLWPATWSVLNRVENKLVDTPPNGPIKHVLVVGGAGYVGSALLPKLLDRGYRVRLLDTFLFGTEPIQDYLKHPNLELVQADFRQVDVVVEAMRGIDAVVHLGAIVGDPACALDEDLTIEINLSAARTVAEIAKGEGVKHFVFASTCSVYGASDALLNENSQLNPVSLYAQSKIAAERVLAQMSDGRFAPTILRFGTIYGLSGRTRFDLVVNLLTAKAVVDGVITVMGGDQWRPFVHVSDAALAVLKALEAPLVSVRGQIFNVGSNAQNYTIEGAAQVIYQMVPSAKLMDMGSDGDRRNYRVSFDKISKVLGYQPEWTLERGVGQVIEAIRSGKVRDYKDMRYSNVKFMTAVGLTRLARPSMNWEKVLIEQSVPQPERVQERVPELVVNTVA